jgi:hypothetical protein
VIAMIASPPVAITYIDSYYGKSMIHATYIWMLKFLNMGVSIEWGYESETEMGVPYLFVRPCPSKEGPCIV